MVTDKIQELQEKFRNSFRYINEEDRQEQLEKLNVYLVTEGDKFCRNHNIKLLINGVPALLALGASAVPAAGAFLAPPVVEAPSFVATVMVGAKAFVNTVFGKWI